MPMSTKSPVSEGGLPKSRVIEIIDGNPVPPDRVEVSPDGGRIYFENRDPVEYRLRFGDDEEVRDWNIDVLLPAHGSVVIPIKLDDEFLYAVIPIDQTRVTDRMFRGPIRN
jgi:hypothetical protein